MFKQILFFLILLFSLTTTASETIKDKTKTALPKVSKEQKVELQLYTLEHKLKTIAQSQLNYKIEKDLLKETYSNNFERINIFIAIVLSIIGVIGYSGIRSINTIKKEYMNELAELKSTKTQFDTQVAEFNIEKEKIDSNLKNISEENKHQNEQIKFLELKSKLLELIKDNNIMLALEFANMALKINPKDSRVLTSKAAILTRLGKHNESCEVLQFCLDNNPGDKVALADLAESLYFNGEVKKAKKLISENEKYFNDKADGKLLDFFNLIELFHNSKIDELKDIAKSYVTFSNKNLKIDILGSAWILTEALHFAHHLKESELKKVLQNLLWYWDGQISGKRLLTELGIELPTKPTQENQQDEGDK